MQNGNPQYYVWYGVVFILVILIVPIFVKGAGSLFEVLNKF